MASFSECWGQLKAKGFKHANGKEVLTDNDKQSILDRTEMYKKEDGLSHDEAIRKSLQEHHDEAHAQVQSIHDQLGIKPVTTEAPPVQESPISTTAQPIQKESGTIETPPTEPTAVTTSPKGQPIETGIANRVLEAEGRTVIPGEGTTVAESVARGQELINKGEDPFLAARRLRGETSRAPSDDMATVAAYRGRLAVERAQARATAEANPKDIAAQEAFKSSEKRESDFIANEVQPAKTEWSRMGVSQQGLAPVDASTFDGLNTLAVDKLGRPLAPGEVLKLKGVEKGVQTKLAAETDSLKRLSSAVDKEYPNIKIPTKEQLGGILNDLKSKLTPCIT